MDIHTWLIFVIALSFASIGGTIHWCKDENKDGNLHWYFYGIAIIIAVWWICRMAINAWSYFEQHPLLAVAIAIFALGIINLLRRPPIIILRQTIGTQEQEPGSSS